MEAKKGFCYNSPQLQIYARIYFHIYLPRRSGEPVSNAWRCSPEMSWENRGQVTT